MGFSLRRRMPHKGKLMSQKCLNPNCKKAEYVRGVCSSCYRIALRLVKEKKISWDALIKNKKILPKRVRGPFMGKKMKWFLGK